jgi:hypothetical protein
MVLIEVGKYSRAIKADRLLWLRLTENLYQMLWLIETVPEYSASEIDITWIDSKSSLVARLYGLDVKYRVTLYQVIVRLRNQPTN